MSHQDSFFFSFRKKKNVNKVAHSQCFGISSWLLKFLVMVNQSRLQLLFISLGWHFSEAEDLIESSEIYSDNYFSCPSFHFPLINVCCICFSLQILFLHGEHRNNKVASVFAMLVISVTPSTPWREPSHSLLTLFCMHLTNAIFELLKIILSPQLILFLKFCNSL